MGDTFNKHALIWLEERGVLELFLEAKLHIHHFSKFGHIRMNFSVFNCSVKPFPRILWRLNDEKRIKALLKGVNFPLLALHFHPNSVTLARSPYNNE